MHVVKLWPKFVQRMGCDPCFREEHVVIWWADIPHVRHAGLELCWFYVNNVNGYYFYVYNVSLLILKQ